MRRKHNLRITITFNEGTTQKEARHVTNNLLKLGLQTRRAYDIYDITKIHYPTTLKTGGPNVRSTSKR